MPTYAATDLAPPALESKDPNAALDYTVDWASWLGTGETISTATWTVPAGLTKGTESKTSTSATVWLSGGAAGATYLVACRITTNQTRTDERSFRLPCRQR